VPSTPSLGLNDEPDDPDDVPYELDRHELPDILNASSGLDKVMVGSPWLLLTPEELGLDASGPSPALTPSNGMSRNVPPAFGGVRTAPCSGSGSSKNEARPPPVVGGVCPPDEPRVGGVCVREGGVVPLRDGGVTARDGGVLPRVGGVVHRDGGVEPRVAGATARDGGVLPRF